MDNNSESFSFSSMGSLSIPVVLFSMAIAFMSSLADVRAEYFVPSSLGTEHLELREKAFTPWLTPEQAGETWRELSPKNIPIYAEHKSGNLRRAIYIPNPGTGYWTLDELSVKDLARVQKEKLAIGDELVSLGKFKDDRGATLYWALWVPEKKAHLITDKLHELGITPARMEYSFADRLSQFSVAMVPFTPVLLLLSTLFSALTFILVAAWIIWRPQPN